MEDMIIGRKPVLDALENNIEINKIYISKSAKGDIVSTIFRLARKKGIVCSFLERRELDKKASGSVNNQGVFALLSPKKYSDFEDFTKIIENKRKSNNRVIFCMLDSVTDPHNVGAIIRSAYAFGIDGIILPKRNSCLINSTVLKASAGAVNFMPILLVNNLNQAISDFKKEGIWFIATASSGEDIVDLKNKLNNRDLCIVLGSEGDGVKRLVLENCDYTAKISLKNNFDSLNVSCAGAVFFYVFNT